MKCICVGCKKKATSKLLFLNKIQPYDGNPICSQHTKAIRADRKSVTKSNGAFRIYILPK